MSGRAALALAVASVLAGVFNYIFQVHAAAALDTTTFGIFSAWLAKVTVASLVASVVQFVSLDFPLREERFNGLVTGAGIVSLALVVGHVVAGREIPPLGLGTSAVLGGITLYAIIGQLQARLRLGDIAASLLVVALVRVGLPFAAPRDARAPSFYVAQAASAFGGVVVAACLVRLFPRSSSLPLPDDDGPEKRVRLGRPILLAAATVVFPQLDVLVLSWTHDAATLGAFSRVALAGRIVFFGGAAIVTTLLPHQLHAAKTGSAPPGFVVFVQRWILPALVVGAIALAGAADVAVLHPSAAERIWLFASCGSAALVIAILERVQRLAAHGDLARAAACVAAVAGASALAAVALSVTHYTLAVLVANAIVLLVSARSVR